MNLRHFKHSHQHEHYSASQTSTNNTSPSANIPKTNTTTVNKNTTSPTTSPASNPSNTKTVSPTSTTATSASKPSTTTNSSLPSSSNANQSQPANSPSAKPTQSTPATPSTTPTSAASKSSSIISSGGISLSNLSLDSTIAEGITLRILLYILIGLIVFFIVLKIILTIYRRYRTKEDYNDNPQIFTQKPDLTRSQVKNIQQKKFQYLINDQNISIFPETSYSGKTFNIKFSGTDLSAVYFDNLLAKTGYFQIEIIKLSGILEIGYMPKQFVEQIKQSKKEIMPGVVGVSLSTSGFVQAEGKNIYNYAWSLNYGDVIGIAIIQEGQSKVDQRRVWMSKNGVLLNRPPQSQLGKWLATIKISAEQKEEYNRGKFKNVKQQEIKEGHETEDNNKQKKEENKQKKAQLQLQKQKISLKTYNPFKYIPVIYCLGNNNNIQATMVNVNVGGQVFRMNDHQFKSGILKNLGIYERLMCY